MSKTLRSCLMKKFAFLLSIIISFVFISATEIITAAETSLQVVPETFDFGWSPDNAVIGCSFNLKNTGGELIQLNSVQPSCGCTATDFTPDSLPSSEQKKINITFNTRGYSGVKFNKSVQVKAGSPEQDYAVHLEGFVSDPNAKVTPEGDGIVEFSEKSSRIKKIPVKNKSDQVVSLSVVQEPSSWVDIKLSDSKIDPGKSVELEAKASGPLDKEQNTSVTFDVQGSSFTQRLTLAFRTGTPPVPYRRIRTAP